MMRDLPPAMNHQPVTSSLFESVAYDPESRVMELRFKNGKVYRAEDVPPHRHEELLAAESIGQHFNKVLKGAHTFTRVDEDPQERIES